MSVSTAVSCRVSQHRNEEAAKNHPRCQHPKCCHLRACRALYISRRHCACPAASQGSMHAVSTCPQDDVAKLEVMPECSAALDPLCFFFKPSVRQDTKTGHRLCPFHTVAAAFLKEGDSSRASWAAKQFCLSVWQSIVSAMNMADTMCTFDSDFFVSRELADQLGMAPCEALHSRFVTTARRLKRCVDSQL